MRGVCLLHSSTLYKNSLYSEMHPVVLCEASLLIDGSLIQGLNRKRHSVCNSVPWIRSQRSGKSTYAGFEKLREKYNSRVGINRGAKKSENLYTVLLVSAEDIENDKVPSVTHNLLDSDSGRSNQSDDRDLKAFDSEQQQKAYKQLGSLDSYFSKLHGKGDNRHNVAVVPDKSISADVSTVELQSKPDKYVSTMTHAEKSTKEDKQIKPKTDLNMLESYFEKLTAGTKDDILDIIKSEKTKNIIQADETEFARELLDIMNILEKSLESAKQLKDSKTIEDKKVILHVFPPSYEVSYNSYLINTLVALNIAVYLFELASPVGNSDIGSVSLPLLYGAKINELILDGQWWRLITPMFLHSGLLHVAFSSWALLTFSPLVDRAYGSLAFCMIYFLGGVCGNLMSFFHTPDAAIGGTGPVFAIIGSWVVYLFQNREAIGEDIADKMIQKVVVASVLSVALSFLTPIDDWTHLGAACAGLIFGVLDCPVVLINSSSRKLLSDPADDSQEGIIVVRKPDPQRLFTVFTLFVATLVMLFFVLAPIISEFHLSNASGDFQF